MKTLAANNDYAIPVIDKLFHKISRKVIVKNCFNPVVSVLV